MALIKCPECQKEISEQATSCPNCGCPISPVKVEQKYCKHCGELIDKDCVICPKCGKQVEDLNASHDDRNIIINNNNSASASATASNINAVPYYAIKILKTNGLRFYFVFLQYLDINFMKEKLVWVYCTFSLGDCLELAGL